MSSLSYTPRFTTLAQWLRWQETLHPNAIDLELERVRLVYRNMAIPDFEIPVIIVAGTNGKGSCVRMLEEIYRAAGYRTGAYTSPHLIRYNERIRVDGLEVDDLALCESFERVDRARETISLTYFEFGTLAALDIFNRAQLDVVILEVGLGGRLDAVNIVDADVALISTIDLDHMQWLGENRESIAKEKMGICRQQTPVVCGDEQPPECVKQIAHQLDAPLYLINRDFHYVCNAAGWEWFNGQVRRAGLSLPVLFGEFQLRNAACVLQVVELLHDRLPASPAHVRQGLLHARLPGRFEVRQYCGKTLILDVAHNGQAAQSLAENLTRHTSGGRTMAVFSVLQDKDLNAILAPFLHLVDAWFIAPLSVARGYSVDALEARMLSIIPSTSIQSFKTVQDALIAAIDAAAENDRVLVCGSFYTVAQAMAHWQDSKSSV